MAYKSVRYTPEFKRQTGEARACGAPQIMSRDGFDAVAGKALLIARD